METIEAIEDTKLIDEKPQADSEDDDEPSRPPHPATRSMRLLSPYVVKNPSHKKSYCRYMYLGSDVGKIHRILLSSEAAVEVVNTLSPSCIWVRLFTHKLEDCIIKLDTQKHFLEPLLKYNRYNQLDESSKAILYNYYMAPRFYDSGTEGKSLMYARVRLLETEEMKSDGQIFYKCLVFYIDYGDSSWVFMDSLADVPKSLLNIPWQVTPVSLLGVSPSVEYKDEEGSIIWGPEHCKILRNLLPKYCRFNAVPAISKHFGFWNYEDYARVDLHALVEDTTTLDQSSEAGENSEETKNTDSNPETVTLASQFCFQCASEEVEVNYDSELSEASQTLLYGVDEVQEFGINATSRMIPKEYCDFHEGFSKEVAADKASDENIEALKKKIATIPSNRDDRNPTKDDKEADKEMLEELIAQNLEKWDRLLKECKTATFPVKPISLKYLREQKLYSKSTKSAAISIINLEECTKSPYEFYGHFVQPSSNIEKLHKYNSKVKEELNEWQKQLNIFYYLQTNWKRLDKDEISRSFSKGESVFGVYALIDEQNEINMYRAQVIAFSGKEHLFIRFLDRGGSMMINQRSLIRLNSKHASKPPMAVQFCLHEISPRKVDKRKSNAIWRKSQCEVFQECIRTDTPMICQLDEIHNHKKEITWFVLGMPHDLTEVFYISKLYSADPDSSTSETTVETLMVERNAAIEDHCSKFESTYC